LPKPTSASGKAEVLVEDETALAFAARLHRKTKRGEMIGVASEAIGDMLDEILPAIELRRIGVNLLRRGRPRCRFLRHQPDHADRDQGNDCQHNSTDELEKGLHLSPWT
jgi:hypothetical protein